MVMIFTRVSIELTEVNEEILVSAFVVSLQEAFKIGVFSDDAKHFGVVDDLVSWSLPFP